MFRRQNLRTLKPLEKSYLEEICASVSAPTGHYIRARVLLALADGQAPANAAKVSMGLMSEEEVYQLIEAFNRIGIKALRYSSKPDPQNRFSFLRSLGRRLRNMFVSLSTSAFRSAVDVIGKLWNIFISLSALAFRSTVNVIRSTRNFSRTNRGRIVIGVLLVASGFGVWRWLKPDPFNPGYVALKPHSNPKQSTITAELLEISLADSQFSKPVPQFIPTTELSEVSIGFSSASVEGRNITNRSIEVTFTSSSLASYSVKLATKETKLISLPSGTYTITTNPNVSGELESVTLRSGDKFGYCIFPRSGIGDFLPDNIRDENPCDFENF